MSGERIAEFALTLIESVIENHLEERIRTTVIVFEQRKKGISSKNVLISDWKESERVK